MTFLVSWHSEILRFRSAFIVLTDPVERTGASSWLEQAVAAFGVATKAKLAGPGDREAAIRSPLEALLGAAGVALGVGAVFHDEVRDDVRGVRPDYALAIDGAISGYVEVKAPGHQLDPERFTGHDARQWQRQRDLPNLVYTNGTTWRLYRDGALHGQVVHLAGGPLATAGAALSAGEDFEALLVDFLRWHPAPITNVSSLVRAIAPLTRLLRAEVLDQITAERAAMAAGGDVDDQRFLGLAADWKALLFPEADDATFADGYAQAVTFALLLARTEDIDITTTSLHTVGARLHGAHSLMGTALQLLTDRVGEAFTVTLSLLVRVVAAVDWPRVRAGRRDAYLHLYERFLDVYDQDLRRASGSYYTPREVVEHMVRLTEQALTRRLGRDDGFADPDVLTVDPAMGTGTYLHTIIEHVADRAEQHEGPGIVPATVTDLAARLVGFEIQMGPYAVAELRTTDLLRDRGAAIPPGGLPLYVTDTLDNPHTEGEQLASTFAAISHSRRAANIVKATTPVTVVIGNPPYRERAEGAGGWIEHGDPDATAPPLLDAFRAEGNGRSEFVLKNLYVYFWRWATAKVFDAEAGEGIVCFITTTGYLRGPGFKGMREYLRRTASEGWIIDVTPEGIRPEVATRIFPGVQQPLAIALFVRAPDTDHDRPATIHHTVLSGAQGKKYAALAALDIDGEDTWRTARTTWQAPFTPAADTDWDTHPALDDLLPWNAPGIKPNRAWVYAPQRESLNRRWDRLVAEDDLETKSALFRESRDASLSHRRRPLAGGDTHRFSTTFAQERGTPPPPVRVGYRSFDRQWLIPDARLLHAPSPDLWAARVPGQVFVVELHSQPFPAGGPGVVFSALIPDMHHFNNRGGRALPLLHPDSTTNLAHGLTLALAEQLGMDVSAEDVLAYLAATIAHPGFTETFADELATPGIRVPLTADPHLWQRAVELGRDVVWLHTYGAAMADPTQHRPVNEVRLPSGDPRRPLSTAAITTMPSGATYDPDTATLHVGDGAWAPVDPRVWAYAVGGRAVVKSWIDYRRADPAGRRSSPLDEINTTTWPIEWTRELTDLLSVLTRLVDLEADQGDLLTDVLATPTLTMDALTAAGVRWPSTREHRRPRRPVVVDDDQLSLG